MGFARLFLAGCLMAASCPAIAQNIGEVALAERDVTGTKAGRAVALKRTDAVSQNEVVATGAESYARLAFHDLTALSIGPQARVTLDRYVFNPDSTAAQVTLNATRGIFRFATGITPSKNITIRTPSATIGLRGTVIDIKVARGREIVVLQEGATQVCTGRACRDIDVPGQGVIITRGGIEGPSYAAAAEFNFDAETAQRFRLFNPQLGNPRGESSGNNGGGGRSSSSSAQ